MYEIKQNRSYHAIKIWLALAFTAFAIAMLLLLRILLPIPSVMTQAPAAVPSSTYLACEREGKLVIFTTGAEAPILVTDIMVSTLPETDRQALQQGITLTSELAITRLLEDYGS